MKELNDTLENALEAVKNGNKTLEVIEEIKNRDVGVVSEEGQEVVNLVRDEEDERLNRKKVTFYIDKVKCSTAIEKVTRALENITDIDSNTIPKRYLDGVIKGICYLFFKFH